MSSASQARTAVYPAALVQEIEAAFPGKDFGLLAQSEDRRLLIELQRIAETAWTLPDVMAYRAEAATGSFPRMSEEVQRVKWARVLLVDAQIAYYAFCKAKYGECPEPDCERPLLPGYLDEKSRRVHCTCPYHNSAHYPVQMVPIPKRVALQPAAE